MNYPPLSLSEVTENFCRILSSSRSRSTGGGEDMGSRFGPLAVPWGLLLRKTQASKWILMAPSLVAGPGEGRASASGYCCQQICVLTELLPTCVLLNADPCSGFELTLRLPNANALTLQLGNLIKRINGLIRCLWSHLLQVRAIEPGQAASGSPEDGFGRQSPLTSPGEAHSAWRGWAEWSREWGGCYSFITATLITQKFN